MINNQKGSVLSVALIMITLLTFSLTQVSSYTFRVAENTNRTIERNDQENEARFRINQAMEYFKIETRAISQDLFENFEENFEESTIIEDIYDLYGVTVTDSGKISSGDSEDEFIARTYDFSYTMENGQTLVRTLYATYGGQEFEEYRTYFFGMATNANVMLNGGEFIESHVYGRWINLNWETLDYNGSNYQILDATISNYTFFDDSDILSENYGACLETGGCINEDDNDYIFHFNDENADINDLGFPLFGNIFRGFNFDEHIHDTLANDFNVVYGEWDNEDYFSGGFPDGASMSVNRYHEGDVTMTRETLDLQGNILVIGGDLTLQSTESIIGEGLILVLGDLNVHSDVSINTSATFFVEGRTHIDFASGHGFRTTNTDVAGMALFTRENLIIDRIRTVAENNDRPRLFFMTNESALINATRQDFNFEGALYAMATSEGDNDKGLVNSDLHPDMRIQRGSELYSFHGILLNSFSGTYQEGDPDNEEDDGTFSPSDPPDGSETWSPGDGRPPWSGGGSASNPGGGGPPQWTRPGRAAGGDHMYSHMGLFDGASSDVTNEFVFMPDFDTLLLYAGDISFESGTFRRE